LGCILGSLYYLIQKKSKRITLFIFFLVWFLAGMAFLMQVFPLDMTVADRWFYFPIVGLLGIFAIILEHLWPYIKKYEKPCFVLAIILLTLLSIRTVIRNNDWRSPIALYSKDIKVYENYDIENYLGAEFVYTNRYDEALPHLLKSVKLLPHDTNLFNVGSVYDHLGNLQKAKEYYELALDTKNVFSSTGGEVRKLSYEGLIRIQLLSVTPEKMNGLITESLQEYPRDGALWAYLAINEYKMNNYENALSASQKAEQLLPNPTTDKLYKMILNKKPLNLR